ncbi:MAG: hypothetical protein K2K36_06600 [Muribaculaceae bacterium]|nr:hypothetical protein [Muribaculaceae bacterium]
MLIELNPKNITDEMMAITALRSISAPDAGTASRRLLTECELDALHTIMRMTFAEIVIRLSAFVERCEIDVDDPADPTAGLRMAIEFANGASLPEGIALPIKRQLEHAVAAATLEWVITEADTSLAQTLRTQHEAVVDAITDTLVEHTQCSIPLWRPAVW